MEQLGLVSLYGPKPDGFGILVKKCQRILSEFLGDVFLPYEIEQVHGTIISLARLRDCTLFNLHYHKTGKGLLKMDIGGYLNYIKAQIMFPITIQIGGFKSGYTLFLSKGHSPYLRSFSMLGTKALVIGWPLDASGLESGGFKISNVLGQMRKAGEMFNIAHMYNTPDFIDNEYYFRIGILRERNVKAEIVLEAENAVREYLSNRAPYFLSIHLSDISLVLYEDETLPIETTLVYPIIEPDDFREISRTLCL